MVERTVSGVKRCTDSNYRDRMQSGGLQSWGTVDAAGWIVPPDSASDKYSRGVLGVHTGSARYPGAAVLGVEAALRTGVGMVRYLGAPEATALVLHRRPEAVTTPGRVQAWLIGSGTDAADRTPSERAALLAALADGVPCAVDAGALDLVERLDDDTRSRLVLTPHRGELARLLDADRSVIEREPARWAAEAAHRLGTVVLLKGSVTVVAGGGDTLVLAEATPWLATAGAGDALGGVLGALLATNHASATDAAAIARIAASAAQLHADAARLASRGGPFTVLDLCHALPQAVRELLRAV